jgi:hypothetical protein
MKKTLQVLRIIVLFILLPIEISKGTKKRAYMNIKRKMVAANML